MRILVRKLVSRFAGKEQRRRLKHLEYQARKKWIKLHRPLTRDNFRRIFVSDLGVTESDTVMVHGGLSLLNTRLNAAELRDLLLEIIGPIGNLVAPTFSPVSAAEYMKMPEAFDLSRSRSGMGAIAECVRKDHRAIRSLHPTKSVAVIGPSAAEICAGHETSEYPFGYGSPFEKLLERNVLIVGIGVPMSYLSCVHVAEDMHPERINHPVWDPGVLHKLCRDGDRQISVATRVHNMAMMAHADPEKFCRKHLPVDQFANTRRSGAPFFSIRARDLQREILRGFDEGFSIYD